MNTPKISKMMLAFVFSLCLSFKINAQCTITANVGIHNWTSPASWVTAGCPAGVTGPVNNQIVIIPIGSSVNLDNNTPLYAGMEIYVYGNLNFNHGQKLNMCPGYLKVFAGGSLSAVSVAGIYGSKIIMCDSTVWNGVVQVFGPLEFGSDAVLPIELLAFTVKRCSAGGCLNWSTSTEVNNDYFSIERSSDAINFETIGTVDGAGNSSVLHSYSFSDPHPNTNKSYYRLRQTDFDGKDSYSELVLLNEATSTLNQEVRLFPNPSSGNEIFIEAPVSESSPTVIIRDPSGRVMPVELYRVDESKIQIKSEANLEKGIYFVEIYSAGSYSTSKLIVR